MTSEQALQLLDQIASSVSMTRANHANAVLAVQTLSQAIANKGAPGPAPKTPKKAGEAPA